MCLYVNLTTELLFHMINSHTQKKCVPYKNAKSSHFTYEMYENHVRVYEGCIFDILPTWKQDLIPDLH